MDGPGQPGSRREARERALGLLYEAESKQAPLVEVLAALPVPPHTFATELVEGVAEHQDELDELIRRLAKGWTLERMPAVDRAVLRLGAYELAHRPEIPTSAVLTEAVELASSYSTDDSGRFVNGMLAKMAEELRP